MEIIDWSAIRIKGWKRVDDDKDDWVIYESNDGRYRCICKGEGFLWTIGRRADQKSFAQNVYLFLGFSDIHLPTLMSAIEAVESGKHESEFDEMENQW